MSNVDTKKLRAEIVQLRCVYGDEEVDRGLAMQVRAIDLAALLNRLDDAEAERDDFAARWERDEAKVEELAARLAAMTEARDSARSRADRYERLEVAALDLANERTRERDAARANARILAHAYTHDSRPPARAVDEALAYPAIPERS